MARAKRQQQIPGTEAPVIAELDDLAEDYRIKRDGRMDLQKEENTARQRLLECVTKHNLVKYQYEDTDGKQRIVTLKQETKVKVNRVKIEDADADDPDDEVVAEPGSVEVS